MSTQAGSPETVPNRRRRRGLLPPEVSRHLEFPVRPAVGARPEPVIVYAAGGSRGALRSRGLLPPAPCLQRPVRSVRAGSAHPLPARRPPAAWPHAGSLPRRGMGREERRGVGDRHCLREQLRLETDGGGRRDNPPSGNGRRDTSLGGHCTVYPFFPLPWAAGRAWRDRQTRAAGPACPARYRGWPGIPLQTGEEPPRRPQPDRLRVPGKVKGGRGAQGRLVCKVPGS